MLSRLFIAPWLCFILISTAPAFQFSAYAADETEHTKASPYALGKKTPDGLGLYYFGREIAHYMTHVGAPWLDRPERAAEERPDLVGWRSRRRRGELLVARAHGLSQQSARPWRCASGARSRAA